MGEIEDSELKDILEQIKIESSKWYIPWTGGWGTPAFYVGIQRWVDSDRFNLRGQICINLDQNSLLWLTKEAQSMKEYDQVGVEFNPDIEGERNPYDWQVDDKVRYEERKKDPSELDSVRDLVEKWKWEAEREIRSTDFKKIYVSEKLVDD